MAARKIDGTWYVDFYFRRERVRMRAPLNTRAGAEQYERALRAELTEHGNLERLDPLRQKAERDEMPTFAEFADRWLSTYVDVNNKPSERWSKRQMLRANILPRLGSRAIDAVSPCEIERFKAELLARGLSPKTINNHLTVIRKMLMTASEWGLVAHVPLIRRLKASPPPFQYLTPPQVSAVATHIGEEPWPTLVLTAAGTGLRYSELIALQWADLTCVNSRYTLTVTRGYVRGEYSSTKTHRIRYVPLPRHVADAVLALPRKGNLIFAWGGRPIPYQRARKRLARATDRAGVPDIGWHALRHTYASELAQRGAPLQIIRDLLGHTNVQMTNRYAHMSPETLLRAVDLLDAPKVVWAAGGQSEAPATPTLAVKRRDDRCFSA